MPSSCLLSGIIDFSHQICSRCYGASCIYFGKKRLSVEWWPWFPGVQIGHHGCLVSLGEYFTQLSMLKILNVRRNKADYSETKNSLY